MIKIIVAMDVNNAIGFNNDLLFNIKEDMKRFKELTTGHFVVMGRKTYESLPKGALPDRKNVVLTREHYYDPSNKSVIVENDFNKIINHYKSGKQDKDLWIIGGCEIYELFMPHAEYIYLTTVLKNTDPDKVDTYFPAINHAEWIDLVSESDAIYSTEEECFVNFNVLQRKENN